MIDSEHKKWIFFKNFNLTSGWPLGDLEKWKLWSDWNFTLFSIPSDRSRQTDGKRAKDDLSTMIFKVTMAFQSFGIKVTWKRIKINGENVILALNFALNL